MAFKRDYCSLSEEFGDFEIEVAEILLDFPRLIPLSNYGSGLPFTWGGKRRRSAEANLGPRRAVHSLPTSLSPSPSPILYGPVGPAITTSPATAAASEPERPITVKAEPATSPATPLSFPPSESDERPKRLKRRVSTKKRKENLLKIISQITESNELLRGEIQKVTQYYEQLKATNSLWKARKQELSMGVIKREDQLNLRQMDLGQATVQCPPAVVDQAHVPLLMPGITVYQQQQQPFIMDRNAKSQEMASNYATPYGQRVSLFQSATTSTSDNMAPPRIPDLTLTIGAPVWMDSKQLIVDDKTAVVKRAVADNKAITVKSLNNGIVDNKVITVKSVNKAIAAQARRRRMLICKNKGSNSSSKLRFSLR
ncbi:unnamed protein product [Dovyalis caffra]|uniref:BZIP domain-containing protein n=1 Tax=Dovyalis caffra TaxID=77055 RepID=A0AAV1S8E7_9ROSI|nr:unnamed protein product [Dovyalis caffra]